MSSITKVPNFGGRRAPADGPKSVQDWAMWDCDPNDTSGRESTQKHGYGRRFDWQFDMQEKAYILEGSATLTADEPDIFGPPVTIEPRDMVTFPKGWSGSWEVHSFIKKRYAFFDEEGSRVDEDDEEEQEEYSDEEEQQQQPQEEEDEEEEPTGFPAAKRAKVDEPQEEEEEAYEEEEQPEEDDGDDDAKSTDE